MAKIKLTETELKQIVSESVKNILSELEWPTYYNAANKALKKAWDVNGDMNNSEFRRRSNQYQKFKQAASDAYSRDYNLNDYDNEAENLGDYDELSSIRRNSIEVNAINAAKQKQKELEEKYNCPIEDLLKHPRKTNKMKQDIADYQNLIANANKKYRTATQGELKKAGERTDDFRKFKNGDKVYKNGEWRDRKWYEKKLK